MVNGNLGLLAVSSMPLADLVESKAKMLREHLGARGINDERVLAAFGAVPREEFVPERYRDLAYVDSPLDIGEGQTISQPYTVALMTQLLNPQSEDVVLEIGTGSGYQAAILSKLAKKVYTIERFKDLAGKAEKVLRQLGCENVEVIVGDGSKGLSKYAPYDGVIITAAAPKLPQPLLDQLKIGGRLVAPVAVSMGLKATLSGAERVGPGFMQEMVKIVKTKGGLEKETYPGFRFVPLVGEHGFKS